MQKFYYNNLNLWYNCLRTYVRQGGKGLEQDTIFQFIKTHYPTMRTTDVAKQLNLSPYQVRSIAKKHNIKKCEKYIQQLKQELIQHRKKWYEANIPDFNPTLIQEQIIYGSLLRDANINKGAQRSVNYFYREHFSEHQLEYRMWKHSMLKDLHFTITGNDLRSISHPYFTSLYPLLYPNGRKSLTTEFLSKCNHPICLATLYLDDGSLTISYQYHPSTNTIYCHPSIILYTLNFTEKENQLLATYFNHTFGTHFVVSKHPDGHKSLLKINKESEVRHFLNLIKPYVKNIPSMKYKTSVTENIKLKNERIKQKFGKDVKIKISSSDRKKLYSLNEISKIVHLKKTGYTNQEIAEKLRRTYGSAVYKIRELRKNGLLE